MSDNRKKSGDKGFNRLAGVQRMLNTERLGKGKWDRGGGPGKAFQSQEFGWVEKADELTHRMRTLVSGPEKSTEGVLREE